MIKIFRRIRLKLLSENSSENTGSAGAGQFSKYLLYAIGEIILVVIGILIALQVNNWNNSKTEKAIEKTYLEALQSEFETNLEILDRTIQLNDQLLEQLDQLLTFFESEKLDTIPATTVAKALGSALSYEVFYDPSTGVQTDIISSGNLKQLRNPLLRQKIASFGNTLEKIKRQEIRAVTELNSLGAFVKKNTSLRTLFEAVGSEVAGNSQFEGVAVKKLFDFMPVENYLIFYQAISQTTNRGYYVPLKKDIEEILEIITSELSK
ncbi:MAG: DUF6090 family protein [Bacteroidota bacterium]